MIESLRRTLSVKAKIAVLCLDAECRSGLKTYMQRERISPDDLELWDLTELEAACPELAAVRAEREQIEYYFSLTPFLCGWALDRLADGDTLIYLDADLWFFSDAAPLLREMGDAPVSVIEHRFPADLGRLEKLYGRFNVGWVGFRRGPTAFRCVARWAELCRQWCRDIPESGKFADQAYLNAWPQEVPDLKILSNTGANLAPWNVRRHRITRSKRKGSICVDGTALIFFHFHRLRQLAPGIYETDFGAFGRLSRAIREEIYRPYLEALEGLRRHCANPGMPESRLVRFEPAPVATPKQLVLAALGILRLFTRRRVVFAQGNAVSPWKGLAYV